MDLYRFLPLALGALLLSACGQGVGDSCQIPSDCDDGLMCCNGGMFGRFGTCGATCPGTGTADAGSADSGVVSCVGGDGTPATLMGCSLASDYCAAAACGAPGSCADVPSECPAVLNPVCGCDGVVYVNDCEAHRTQVTVDPSGDACMGGGLDAGQRDAGSPADSGSMIPDAGMPDAGSTDAGSTDAGMTDGA